jgi:hypothetical protein
LPEFDVDAVSIGALKVSTVIAAVWVLSSQSVSVQRLLVLGQHVFSCRASAEVEAEEVEAAAVGE